MMRKVLFLVLSLIVILSVGAVASAEPNPALAGKTAIIIAGPSDFKTPDFMEILTKSFSAKYDPASLIIGTDPQNRYQAYWDKKGFLAEQPMMKTDITDFVAQNEYSQVLFLIISPPQTEVSKIDRDTDRTRVTVEMRGVLVKADGPTVVTNLVTNQSGDSLASALRARRDAFERGTKFFAENIYLSQMKK